jgi:hypothetical protein
MTPIQTVLAKLPDATESGDGWQARCPAHEDDRPSLSIGEGEDGKVLLHCHAGCDFAAIVAKLGLEQADLFDSDSSAPPRTGKAKKKRRLFATANEAVAWWDRVMGEKCGRRTGRWVYHDPKGKPVGLTLRWDPPGAPKEVRPVSRHADGWHVEAMSTPRPLYRLPELAAAECVTMFEGERKADTARKLGYTATTSAGGAKAWGKTDWSPLAGKTVWIFPDNDDAGRTYADGVASTLRKLKPAAVVRFIVLPDLPESGDIVDYVAAQRAAGLDDAAICTAIDQLAKTPSASDSWEEPMPLGEGTSPPPFPAGILPEWLENWVIDEATKTQTPPDLAALLVLAAAGAGIAGKCAVQIRPGWTEPANIFTVVALRSGERKSAVFCDMLGPIQALEREERERLRPLIATAESRRRVLENRLKAAERKAAKGTLSEATKAQQDADKLAKELADHVVPEWPRLFCDDATPEALEVLLCKHGGRMFQAADEGTAFEIAKGRYSETANFDVYLKGHAGSPLRTDRVKRDAIAVDAAYLSVGLAVQPDVLQGLHGQTSMRGRGFLARWLYAVPESSVGERTICAPPMPKATATTYFNNLTALWKLPGDTDDNGRPQLRVLRFSHDADGALQDFERWLEPQLGDGAVLFWLSGWANKLAGAVARIAGILHAAESISRQRPEPWRHTISRATVERAIQLGREYLLPHATAAFGVMEANEETAKAQRVLSWLAERFVTSVTGVTREKESSFLEVSRRVIHRALHRVFLKAEDVDPPVRLLIDHGWLRPAGSGKAGRGL